MRNKIIFFMKRVLIFICTATLVLSTTACSLSKTDQQSMSDQVETRTDDLKKTVFENDIEYLSVKGIQLPDLPPNSTMLEEIFLSLLMETYEALGAEIDISKGNPRNESSDAIKKMSLIGVYDGYFIENDRLSSDLNYGSVAYFLMKMQDSIQKRLYIRNDSTARIGDLLRRMGFYVSYKL